MISMSHRDTQTRLQAGDKRKEKEKPKAGVHRRSRQQRDLLIIAISKPEADWDDCATGDSKDDTATELRAQGQQ